MCRDWRNMLFYLRNDIGYLSEVNWLISARPFLAFWYIQLLASRPFSHMWHPGAAFWVAEGKQSEGVPLECPGTPLSSHTYLGL